MVTCRDIPGVPISYIPFCDIPHPLIGDVFKTVILRGHPKLQYFKRLMQIRDSKDVLGQIQELRLQYVSHFLVKAFHKAFSSMTRLHTLVLHMVSIHPSTEREIIALPSLKRLTISFNTRFLPTFPSHKYQNIRKIDLVHPSVEFQTLLATLAPNLEALCCEHPG